MEHSEIWGIIKIPFTASSAIFISLLLIIFNCGYSTFFKKMLFDQFFKNFIGYILVIFFPFPQLLPDPLPPSNPPNSVLSLFQIERYSCYMSM